MKVKQVILIFALSNILAGCNWFQLFECENFVELEKSSDKFTATFFTRGCGAATSDHPYLNVRKLNQKFDFEDEKKQVLLPLKNEGVKFYWKNSSTLVVECESCLKDEVVEVNRKVNHIFQDFKVEYQSKSTVRK